MAWFKKTRKPIASATAEKPSRVPEGLWIKCPGCAQLIYKNDLEQNLNVCPKCAHHFRITSAERLRALFDGGKYIEYYTDLTSTDPLQFTDTKPYRERLQKTIQTTGLKDACVVATGQMDGLEIVVAAMEYQFIGGSMSSSPPSPPITSRISPTTRRPPTTPTRRTRSLAVWPN